jgi:hypothetical protein
MLQGRNGQLVIVYRLLVIDSYGKAEVFPVRVFAVYCLLSYGRAQSRISTEPRTSRFSKFAEKKGPRIADVWAVGPNRSRIMGLGKIEKRKQKD